MSYTVGDNNTGDVACFPPWPTDWCKSKGGQAPPPWGENDQRGDQTVGGALPSGASWIFYGGVALLVIWLGVRVLEAYAALKRD